MTASTPDPRKQLEQAQSAYDDLASDLAILSTDLEAAEGALRVDRRKGGGAKALSARGAQVASLRAIVEDQRADVAEAAAALERAKYAAQRFEVAEVARAAAVELDKLRDQIAKDLRELAPAVAAPVARIAAAANRWRELFDAYADSVAQLEAIAATEAGTEPADAAHILADPAAWQRSTAALEAAGVAPAAFRDHPHGDAWARARAWNGPAPAFIPRLFTVPLPDLVAPLTTDPKYPAQTAWAALDAPELARQVAAAVLDGTLDAKARATA